MLQAASELRSSPASVQTENMTEDNDLRSKREYHLVPHHKSGWLMSKQAYDKMAKKLKKQHGFKTSQLKFSATTMGMAVDSSLMKTRGPPCVAQFGRNPFEMVVSGYLYHMAESEPWLHRSFRQVAKHGPYNECKPSLIDGQTAIWCKEHKRKIFRNTHWMHKAFRGINQVAMHSVSTNGSTFLPHVDAKETFPQYLKRVSLDAGLIAEYIWASNASLAPMRFTHDFAESHACSKNMCFHEFYENCKDAWQRLMHAWQVEEPQYTLMLSAALKSCPRGNHWARKHSSKAQMKNKLLNHPPAHDMVKRLRELDRLHLNGAIAELEEHIGCPVSGKYKEPA